MIEIISFNGQLQYHISKIYNVGGQATRTILLSFIVNNADKDDEEIYSMMSEPNIFYGSIPRLYLESLRATYQNAHSTIFKISLAGLLYFAGDKSYLMQYINDGYFGDKKSRALITSGINRLSDSQRQGRSIGDAFVLDLLFPGLFVDVDSFDHLGLSQLLALDITSEGRAPRSLLAPLPWIK